MKLGYYTFAIQNVYLTCSCIFESNTSNIILIKYKYKYKYFISAMVKLYNYKYELHCISNTNYVFAPIPDVDLGL